MQFLKQTTVNKHGHSAHLNQLPWYLLIGPSHAGKTTLLANSKVHYILQRQFPAQQTQPIAPSENCDWWVTRDANIIDVPGTYIYDKSNIYAVLWKCFLRLIKKQRGKNALSGIIIAMSLPELMKQGDSKKYLSQLRSLFLRMSEIHASFSQPLPCYLVVTKCDQLAGFSEFFAESSDDEISQAWGVTLPALRQGEKIYDLLAERFNTLIKKLNQQLLWRLHQERNPMARPYIKDFPLQVERLKEFTLDFIKKLSDANPSLQLQGIYLTSALQHTPEPEANIIEGQTNSRAIQIFKEPTATSRPYFIKQFILQGLVGAKDNYQPAKPSSAWKRRTAYAASVGIIGLAAVIFGKDFEQAIKQAYSIQNTLSDYQLAIQQSQDEDEHLAKTIALLNSLQQTANKHNFKLDVMHILTFYSNKSKQKSSVVYHHALQNILMPEIKTYLGEYLKNPVNKNTEYVYATLKAYLMLGDTAHFQPDFISNTLRVILPKSMNTADTAQLINHVGVALKANWNPVTLDNNLILETRRYLTALPSFQLGYVILKNINSNNIENEINLGTNNTVNSAFVSHQVLNQIPQMFTAKAFSNIISQETVMAAQESTSGNWIIGNELAVNNNPDVIANLLQQLRNTYVNNYIDAWESLLANIRLVKPDDLAQTDAMITSLISNDSPLLQLLQTLHDNTYFEPIASSSPKLQSLGLLVDKNNQSNNMLYQIFAGLQSLHQYLHAVLTAENERKAAFDVVAIRMQHAAGNPDVITQLRLIAEKSPEPIKSWLDKIANDAWRFLVQDATRYIDTSWQEQVGHTYQLEIANHYPFSPNATQEVELNKFTDFFGNPGTLLSFYNQYLLPFIDTSTPDWRWKNLDNQKLPFSDDTLHQLQYALRIHHMFFPNGDNKLHVQFALQPVSLSKYIKRVKLSINDKKIIDLHSGNHNTHLLAWPSKHETKMTSVQVTTLDQKVLSRDFPGDWGWFKLVNQSFISAISHKTTLINLSENNYPVKYLLFTQGQFNPFLSLNLQNFHLPQQLLLDTDKQHA